MKKLILAVLSVIGLLSASPVLAQGYGTWAYCGGVYRFGNCGGPTQYQMVNNQRYGNQMIPLQGMPGMFQQGTNLVRCSTGDRVIGGLIGGALGYALGKNITTNGHRLNGLGAVVGAGLGQQISCEIMGTVPMAPQFVPQQPVMQQQVTPQQMASVQPGGQGTFCNIDGIVTQEVNGAACVAKAKAKAETLVSGQNVDMEQQNQPTCAQGKTWTKLNWPGHHQHDGFVCLPDGDSHRY